MGRFILKIHDDTTSKDYYLEWSTVVDAPVTYGVDLETFKTEYEAEYGAKGMRGLNERLGRADKTGSSGLPPYDTGDDFFGDGSEHEYATKEEILDRFCRNHIG